MSDTRAESLESRLIELAPLKQKPGRLLLKLEGVRHSRRSFEVRFFVDSPNAAATTQVTGNERYGGNFYMYGHGLPGEQVVGEAALLEGYVAEAGKDLEPFEAVVDITRAASGLILGAPVRITLVVLDENGAPMPRATFKFDRASLEVRPD